MDNRKEYILCAAIHYDDHILAEVDDPSTPDNIETGFILCGYRHDNIMAQARKLFGIASKGTHVTQGFLTSENRFVDREEAAMIAKTADQLIPPYNKYRPVQLFSEHIY